MKRNSILIIVLGVIVITIMFLQSKNLRQQSQGTVSAPLTITEPPITSTSTQPVAAPVAAPGKKYLTVAQKAKQYSVGRELAGISGYINLPEGQSTINLKDLVGKKVILIDFWTYSCINCQRTIPYVNAWYKKYHDAGLEIIGVHTPEFDFEKDINNVRAAVAKFGIRYPVVQDNEYATWSAYQNQYWPREYLIDIDGFIVHDKIGEGEYDQTEAAIQKALSERADKLGAASVPGGTVSPNATAAPKVAVSPETYFGSKRNAGAATQLSGTWDIKPEYIINKTVGDTITYPYVAQHIYIVASADTPIIMKVLRDGKPLTADIADEDVNIGADGMSTVTIKEARLYRLIKESSVSQHSLELIPQSPGLQAFTFTFG